MTRGSTAIATPLDFTTGSKESDEEGTKMLRAHPDSFGGDFSKERIELKDPEDFYEGKADLSHPTNKGPGVRITKRTSEDMANIHTTARFNRAVARSYTELKPGRNKWGLRNDMSWNSQDSFYSSGPE